MKYPKPIMSINELHELGIPTKKLKNLAHAKGAPVFRTDGGRKFLFYTDELDKFLRRQNQPNQVYIR